MPGRARAERPLKDIDCAALARRHGGAIRNRAKRLAPHARLATAMLDADDLFSIGLTALWDAALRHDGRPDATLWAFARRRVAGAMLDAIRAASWVPRSRRGLADNPTFVPLPRRHPLAAEVALESRPEARDDGGFDALLRGLRPIERQALTAYYRDERRMSDIAASLGI